MQFSSSLCRGGTHQHLGGLLVGKMLHATLVTVAWACLAGSSAGLASANEDPKGSMQNFVDRKLGESYMDAWKKQPWDTASHGCGADKLPAATKTIIRKTCGDDTNTLSKNDRCICIVAKAHSCHVGCSSKLELGDKSAKAACPSSCLSPSVGGECGPGESINGGVKLSEQKCYKFCSQKAGRYRFCGVGSAYKSGSYVDCTGCDPSNARRNLRHPASSGAVKRARWTECMADCYPTPTCAEMCAEGTKECYDQCVARYSKAVEPYFDMFKSSGTLVSDYVPASSSYSDYLAA